MPGILRGRIVQARSLPIMDTSTHSTDAYAELRLGRGTDVLRTPTCRRSLNPVFNYDFRYEVHPPLLSCWRCT